MGFHATREHGQRLAHASTPSRRSIGSESTAALEQRRRDTARVEPLEVVGRGDGARRLVAPECRRLALDVASAPAPEVRDGEYWNVAEVRWVGVDGRIDDVHREMLPIDFDPFDVPHDRFVIERNDWAQCRVGRADAAQLGIFKGDLRGHWFIAGDLVRDFAALNQMEMRP